MTSALGAPPNDPGTAPDPPRRPLRLRGDLIAVLLAALLVTAASVIGFALIRRGVPIKVDFPPLLAQWLPHVGPGTVPAILVALVVALRGPALAERLGWRPLLLLAYVASLAWTFSLALIDGWFRGVAERLATDTEYLRVIPIRGTLDGFLADFARRIPSLQRDAWPTHVAGHPPLATLFYDALNKLGLPGGDWAGAVTGAVGASAVVAVAITVAALAGRDTARRYLPFGVLLPGAVWVGVSADGMFAGVLAWGVALFALGCVHRGVVGLAASLAGGVVLGSALFLSYGLVLAGVLPLAVALAARRVVPLIPAGLGAGAVVWIVAAHGFWWWDGYEQVKIRYYQPREYGLLRPYEYWVWANLAALVLVLGPAVVAGLRRITWRPRSTSLAVVLLVGAGAVAIAAADASGLSKAETERIWLPFAVWVMVAATLLPRRTARWWLLAQAALALVVNHLLLTVW